MAIHKENIVLFALVLLDLAVLVELMGDDRFVVGIVLPHLVQLMLMILNLLHEGRHVWQWLQRRLRVGNRRYEGSRDCKEKESHETSYPHSIISRYAGTVGVVPD